MDTRSNRMGAVIGAVATSALALGVTTAAHAGCAYQMKPDAPSAAAKPYFAVYNPDEDGTPMLWRVSAVPAGASIVGLWKFEMLAKGNEKGPPDGTLLDFGTQAWHSDGTELMNSGIRNPADGDFCQGVWKKVGPSTYALNHMALAWMSGSYLGPVIIHMTVKVAPDGNSFEGDLTETVYAASPDPGQEFDTSTQVVKLTGTITGTRIGDD